jgi:hypothetical protein
MRKTTLAAIFGASVDGRSRARAAPGRPMARVLAACCGPLLVLMPLVLGAGASKAAWLDKLVAIGEPVSHRGGHGGLDRLAARLQEMPAGSPAALAAEATPVGHWRFANRAGEIVTAGTPDELKRVASVLLPEVAADARLEIYVDEDTVFLRPTALAELPKASEVNVVVGRDPYRVVGRDGAGERLFAKVRSNLLVELGDRKAFEEAVWQLQRPLEAAAVRVLALEPGAPPTLSLSPRTDATGKRALVDAIDPASLAAALGAIPGQTVLITARIDGRLLFVQPASGSERSLILADLFAAAEEADVNLVVLHSAATPRQPGGRNWLWQKVEVSGLDQALQHARVADFYNALGDMFSTVLSEITGRVVVTAVAASLRSAERERELELRIIPGVPADAAAAYLLLVVLGLIGMPASRAWWRRMWPPEAAAEYAGRVGYLAARAVRGFVFLLLFLPLSACLSVPLLLTRSVSGAMAASLALRHRLSRRRAAAG